MIAAARVFGSPEPQLKRQMPTVQEGVWRFSFCDKAGIMVRQEECWLTLEKPWVWHCDFCGELNECG